MPELPEVDALVRSLRARLTNTRVIGVWVGWPKTIHAITPAQFTRRIIGCRFARAQRRAKYLVFPLLKGGTPRKQVSISMLVHLRMSGRLDFLSGSGAPRQFDRLILRLDNGGALHFRDVRKFGRFYLSPDSESVLERLGPEPLSKAFSRELFGARLLQTRKMIKPLLLDQSFIAGLGNIYVDEVLWRAKIHPCRSSGSLTNREAGKLHEAIVSVLKEAITASGTDFGDGVVPDGRYEPRVYGAQGKPCGWCASTLKRIVVAQRGTHLCPHCQHL